MTKIIGGPYLGSLQQPANGWIYAEYSTVFQTSKGTLTRLRQAISVINGELFFQDGVTPLDMEPTPKGVYVTFHHDINGDAAQKRWCEVPDSTSAVRYWNLIDVFPPAQAAEMVRPTWVTDALLEAQVARTGAEAAQAKAAGSATAAAGSATAAATSATAAATARTGSETARDASVTAKGQAETARTGAQTAQTAAAGSATAAATSATAAATARTGSETARDASVTAKGQAETARTGAQTSATAAAGSATDAATSASGAAAARTGAETARAGAETARNEAEAFGGTGNNIVAGYVGAAGPTRDALDGRYTRPGGTDVTVADGGTGRSTSGTANGVLAAGTTAVGPHQTIAPGTVGQVLTSNGPNALPGFKTLVNDASPSSGQVYSSSKVVDLIRSLSSSTEGNYAARPAATDATEGALYFAWDVAEMYRFTGGAWRVVGSGGNELGYAELTTRFLARSTSPTDVPGLSITFVAGERPLLFEFSGEMTGENPAASAVGYIELDGAIIGSPVIDQPVAAMKNQSITRTARKAGLVPGSTHTVKFRIATSNATYAVVVNGYTYSPAALSVRTR